MSNDNDEFWLAPVANRFGQTRTGRAVMRGPCGWVLNMGGPHGTPAVATEETIEQVQPQGSKAIGHWRRSSLMTTDMAATATLIGKGRKKVIFRR
jgi:hypothetical protein